MEFTYADKPILEIQTGRHDAAPPTYLRDTITGSIRHDSILRYLKIAYDTHYGIVVSPDMIWYTILCEMSRIVKASPDLYKPMFTAFDKVMEIAVPTLDPEVMPIPELLTHLFGCIPPGIKETDIILPLSTSTYMSQMACATAFLEAASPYYVYSMYACGFNKILVEGTSADYATIVNAIARIGKTCPNTPLYTYLTNAQKLCGDITIQFDSPTFWLDIFHLKRCGSGSQYEVGGWFAKLFYEHRGVKEVHTFPNHASRIEYTNLTTGLKYEMTVGLLSSNVVDGYMIPEFAYGVNELNTDVHRNN